MRTDRVDARVVIEEQNLQHMGIVAYFMKARSQCSVRRKFVDAIPLGTGARSQKGHDLAAGRCAMARCFHGIFGVMARSQGNRICDSIRPRGRLC